MSNPFTQNQAQGQTQGQAQGLRFGNAYETEPSRLPPMSATGYNNAWGNESNKTEYTAPMPEPIHIEPPIQSAYKYTGTPYANQEHQYSPVATQEGKSVGPKPWNGETYRPPNKGRLWVRFILLLGSVGHLGFAAGAKPYSGQDVPFYTSACFYYLFAVAALSILWTCVLIFHYCYRRIAKKPQMNKPTRFSIDLLMALLWGIGVIVEVVKFRCTDGSKFCAFYNVSIFFGFLVFAGYIMSLFLDIFGGCCSGRNKKK